LWHESAIRLFFIVTITRFLQHYSLRIADNKGKHRREVNHMPKKRSTRHSNNTSINTDNSVNNNTGSNAAVENEDIGKKQKNKPYYSWW
jgi:hypothetical protein